MDEQIQATGFGPDHDYGMADSPAASNGGNGNHGTNGNSPHNDRWQCSDKQRELILKLVDEHSLDRNEVDQLARDRFGKGVKQLGKMEASGLIDELLETHGGGNRSRSNGNRRNAYNHNHNHNLQTIRNDS